MMGQLVFRIDKVKNADRDDKNDNQAKEEVPEFLEKNPEEARGLPHALPELCSRFQTFSAPYHHPTK